MYSALRLVTPPASLPVTLAQVVNHLRLDSDADESTVMGYAEAATQWTEAYLNRALITQTLQYTLSDHLHNRAMYLMVLPLALEQAYMSPHQYIELPRPPVQSVTSVSFTDRDGTATPISDISTNLSAEPGVVTINYMSTLGVSYTNLQVTYKAGYGDSYNAVPASIKQAILMLTAYYYENRGDTESGDMPRAVTRLLSNYRLAGFA